MFRQRFKPGLSGRGFGGPWQGASAPRKVKLGWKERQGPGGVQAAPWPGLQPAAPGMRAKDILDRTGGSLVLLRKELSAPRSSAEESLSAPSATEGPTLRAASSRI